MRYILLAFLIPFLATPAFAADVTEAHLTLKNHIFVPQELNVPAGQKIKIILKNEDNSAAEFESTELNREKIVTANGEISVYVGPLDAGRYGYFDDFHRDTTTGTIIAK